MHDDQGGRAPSVCPPGFQGEYTVVKGDTMFFIAKRFCITLEALIHANPHIPNPNLIYPGDVLCVPALLKDRLYTTGPLAIDPVLQAFIGLIVENTSTSCKTEVKSTIWLINKEPCPKEVFDWFSVRIPPGCSFILAPRIWSFFYEVIIKVPPFPDINITIYGLTENFQLIGANTIRHTELKTIHHPPVTSSPPKKIRAKDVAKTKKQWISDYKEI